MLSAMCGRYRLSQTQRFAEINELRLGGEFFAPRYNVAPTQRMPVVLDAAPHEFSVRRWGLVPWWSKEMMAAVRCVNARASSPRTAGEPCKTEFRPEWRLQRDRTDFPFPRHTQSMRDHLTRDPYPSLCP
jgi:putative SOS response-associated peptidase YedK